MQHLPSIFLKVVLVVIVFYSPMGWCPCPQCQQEEDGSYTCSNFDCENFIPETDEQQRKYDEHRLARYQRHQEQRPNPVPQQTESEVEGACALDLPDYAEGACALDPPDEANELRLDDLIARMVGQHESFWGVMITAIANYCRYHQISLTPDREPITRGEIRQLARAHRDSVHHHDIPEPNSWIPDLLYGQQSQANQGFSPELLQTSLINQGYLSEEYPITSNNDLESQLATLLPQGENMLAVLTYSFIQDQDLATQHFVFQLNSERQVFFFSDVQSMPAQIKMLPGLFELIYMTVYDFEPEDGDGLTLTIHTLPPTFPETIGNAPPTAGEEESDDSDPDQDSSHVNALGEQQHLFDLLNPSIPLYYTFKH